MDGQDSELVAHVGMAFMDRIKHGFESAFRLAIRLEIFNFKVETDKPRFLEEQE